jgi:hypothetical protein
VISSVSSSGHGIRFVLGSSGPAKSFQCALVRGARAAGKRRLRYSACGPIRVYRHLAPGRYTFYARAVGLKGGHRAPARHSFSIR